MPSFDSCKQELTPQTPVLSLYQTCTQMMSSLKVSPKVDGPDISLNRTTITDTAGMASAINDFFIAQNKLSIGDSSEDPPDIACPPQSCPAFLTPYPQHLRRSRHFCHHYRSLKALMTMDVPTHLLKLTSDEIAPSLARHFNTPISRCEMPVTGGYGRAHLQEMEPHCNDQLQADFFTWRLHQGTGKSFFFYFFFFTQNTFPPTKKKRTENGGCCLSSCVGVAYYFPPTNGLGFIKQ